jgi:mannose-1-phosphate guanylyltransferase/mannose-6-phosphate isomerase
MKVIILAGGSGTRLWPLSRTNFPKQFLKLNNPGRSLFQMTMERSRRLATLDNIYIVTNAAYKFLVLGQIEELGFSFDEANVLLEPVGKNTLPAILYGVKEIQKRNDDLAVVFPSDHIIQNEADFLPAIQKGEALANEYLVTYGVKPDQPHTGYGYIKPGESLGEGYQVAEFKEKPGEKAALSYLEKGYLWNSGMFMFHTGIFTEEVEQHCPQAYLAFAAEDIGAAYENIPAISVDYGVMEKSKRLAVIPLAVKWSDLGNFDAFYNEFPRDERGNVTFNGGILLESANNLLYTAKDKVTALIGVDDLIVVDEKDALLICDKNHVQKVREVVAALKEAGDSRVDFHLTTFRPWGSYTILEEGSFYKIKRTTVLPGKRLSYQLHHHRSEHWIVVQGTAKVTVEGSETLVRSGESTFVQSGKKHRLENPGKVLLEVIEVQLGEYLEEDDIIRFDDDFGRS